MNLVKELVNEELALVEDALERAENRYDNAVDGLSRAESEIDTLLARRNTLKRNLRK